MEKESRSARQQDTFKMKESISEFFSHHSGVPQGLPVPRNKTGRGFSHMWTARALCPRSYICSFTEESEYVFRHLHSQMMSKLMLTTSFLERISNGDVAVTSDQFPNFLYNEDEAEDLTEENPDDWDAEKGLLRSSLCLWVSCSIFMLQILWAQFIESYKCIFMGNGSWKPSDKNRKGPVSRINGMTQVTPPTIAYAVAQVCFHIVNCFSLNAI
jgi:hypothetical protein